MSQHFGRRWLIELTLLLIAVAASISAPAAISEGPTLTNAGAAARRRDLQFYEAQQSFEEKLKVGRERFRQKEANRARIIRAMDAEFQARQRIVGIHSKDEMEADATHAAKAAEDAAILAFFGIGLIAFFCYAKRVGLARGVAAVVRPIPRPMNLPAAHIKMNYKVTALLEVSLWATTEGERQANWIHLQPGEVRDQVRALIGVHPRHAPRGKRISLGDNNPDIVLLEEWGDIDLPKAFFDAFTLEVSRPAAPGKTASRLGLVVKGS
jgi:hypothetical protein